LPSEENTSPARYFPAYTFWVSSKETFIGDLRGYANMRQSAAETPVMLNSWKEIANYLGRGVRTVQRWERELGLPVHRIGNGRRSPVYAIMAELKFWIATSDVARIPQSPPRPNPMDRDGHKPIQNSRRLLASLHELARTMAENSVRQHHQAELLQSRLVQMR